MSAPKQKSKKIGGNWVETLDPNTGKTYYANVVTKEVTWSRPDAKIKKEEAEARKKQNAKAHSSSMKNDTWLERQDPQGRVYYYNPARKETSWHRPDKVISSGAIQAAESAKAASQWKSRVDPRSGRTYYYNPSTRQTSWTNPEEEAKKEAEKANQGAVKRLSVNLAAGASNAGNRLSMGLKRISNLAAGAGGGMNRHSARYSVGLPMTPVNRTEARMSVRLGSINLGEGRNSMGRMSLGTGEADPFAALKALKNQGELPSNDEPDLDLEHFLHIDLDKECKGITADIKVDVSFRVYASQNFLTRKKPGFVSGGGGQLDLGKMGLWQNSILKQPLHNFSDSNLSYDAKLAFKNILFFCGDKNTRKTPQFHAQIFLATGQAPVPELHDELYCQLIKQATSNPNIKSLQRVWKLTALACGTFDPSPAFRPYLLAHLKSGAEQHPDAEVNKFARYACCKLKKVEGKDSRLEVPSEREIDSVINYQPFKAEVTLINNTRIEIDVESWNTIADINDAVAHRLQIKDGVPFTCFEVNQDDMERVLEDTDRVMDIVSYWDREISAKKKKKNRPEFKFVYKLRLFFDIDESDTSAIELAYFQAVFDVNDSRYPCSEEDAINLAAFEAQNKYGDYDGTDVFEDKVGAYIPAIYYDPDTEEDLKQRIYNQYQELSGYDSFACKVNYLDYVKSWKYYGSAYYFAEPITNKIFGKEFPKLVILGINAKGILIIDPINKDLLAEFPFSEIVTWGHSAENLVFVVGNLVRSKKMFFDTEEGMEINSLIHAYVNKLLSVEQVEN